MAPTGLKEVDSLKIELVVDNDIEWLTALPSPPFTGGIHVQLSRSPPIDQELTGLPIMDLENYCCGAHGLAFLLTTSLNGEHRTILFDTGPESKSIARNIDALKINLTPIERIVLSHWHADHSGGILTVLRNINASSVSSPIPVDLHPKRPTARGISKPPTFKPICRLPADPTFDEIKEAGGVAELHDEPHVVANGTIFVSGEIERKTEWEKGLVGAITWIDGKWEKDELIMDERYVVVNVKDKGLVVFSSCSHAGIINVLHSARKQFPSRPIHMILGGLHLAGNDFRDRIPPTVNAFVQPEFNPDYIVPLHCTGFDAKVALRDKMGEKIVPGGVGLNVFVSAT